MDFGAEHLLAMGGRGDGFCANGVGTGVGSEVTRFMIAPAVNYGGNSAGTGTGRIAMRSIFDAFDGVDFDEIDKGWERTSSGDGEVSHDHVVVVPCCSNSYLRRSTYCLFGIVSGLLPPPPAPLAPEKRNRKKMKIVRHV